VKCTDRSACGAEEICGANGYCETPAQLEVVTAAFTNATVGAEYAAQVEAAGGTAPYTFALTGTSSLPAGLTLYPDGALTGTPAHAGSANVIVVVTDATGATASRSLTLVVLPPTGLALLINTAGLPNGSVGTAYSVALAATGGSGTVSWSLANGSLPAGLSLSSSGDISGTPVSAGSTNFTVQVTDTSSPPQLATATLSLTVEPATGTALSITTTVLAGATVGTAYSAQLQATGGTLPLSWSLAAGSILPHGLSLSSGGLISGTPTRTGTSTFTLEVTDASNPQQTASTVLTLVVAGAPGSVTVTTYVVPGGTVGVPYNAQLQANGGTKPYTWSVSGGALPPGLSLSAAGQISGTPTASGFFFVTVEVTDSTSPTPSTSTGGYMLSVNAAAGQLQVVTMFLPPGRDGTAYNAMLAASNGTPPYTWSMVSGSFPSGLSLGGDGTISGTPTASGTSIFIVKVTDNLGAFAEKQLSITVHP
jgi:hypothetical protein